MDQVGKCSMLPYTLLPSVVRTDSVVHNLHAGMRCCCPIETDVSRVRLQVRKLGFDGIVAVTMSSSFWIYSIIFILFYFILFFQIFYSFFFFFPLLMVYA
ncbi:hypothetical protein P168DRAFT_18964 [Aspergillus campestris IBT 28561]|uniref:Uncharacterized protein n=1 Tax=Aspergillus campestris (strain IBT 28561) TaxID=1392248 RepID=A0A2I1DFB7_ASPC2|nr:uncharacterized protein P168DRAFT_18964 [Aspergillus campestris IBT 28561]PKY08566.1 hypothetical protein P168DRAFT_18964 [Aspergillus campestris IBT 28561]